MKVCVEFDWRDVGEIRLGTDGKLMFPDLPATAGIYRFRLATGGKSSVYIGEGEDLRRRAAQYRTPGPTQQTNIRLNGVIRQLLTDGGSAHVSVGDKMTLTIDGAIVPLDLHKNQRRLLEETALVAAIRSGVEHVENL